MGIDQTFTKNIERIENPSISVWIIDDNEAFTQSLSRFLRVKISNEIDLSVACFSDGESVISRMVSDREILMPDVITIDGDLGDDKKRGEEIVKEIAPYCENTIIVAMSGDSDSNNKMQEKGEKFGRKIKVVQKSSPEKLLNILKESVGLGADTDADK